MSPDIFLNFLLALLVGGLIGIERNMPSTVSTTEPPPEESDLG